MPKVNGVGYSESTMNKQFVLKKILEKHLYAVDYIFRSKTGYFYRKNYLYIDATCGNGSYKCDIKSNQNKIIKGSPLIFLDTLKKVINMIGYTDCYFIDKNITSLEELKKQIYICLSDKVKIIEGDYSLKIPSIIEKHHNYFGLIYFDPNGIVDLDFIIELSKQKNMKKIDILFNYNGTAFKRKKTMLKLDERFIDYFKEIKKLNWYISEPSGKWQWSFLFGTNTTKIRLPKSYGFHNVTSHNGKLILRKLNYTKDEFRSYLPSQKKLTNLKWWEENH